jgi:lysophospholipase L1-like esterase
MASGSILTIAILMGILVSSPLVGQVDSTYRFYFYDQRYSLFEALETKPGQIIMLGNSITNGGNWSELLGNNRVINRGISGDNTFGVLNRLDEIVSSQPEKIFILIGINDLSRETPVDVILNNYRRIVSKIQLESPETRIYVQSLFPTNNEFDHFPRAQNKDDEIRAVNIGIEKIAGEYGITFIDLYPHFMDKEGKLSKEYTNDGLHLMGKGYLKWTEIIRPFVEEE